jgi:hypothetical protein
MAKRDPYSANRTEPFNTAEMQAMTEVSAMSLYLWKTGTATKKPLPYRKNDSNRCLYPVKQTLNWLKRYDIPLQVHPDDVAKSKKTPARKKPGPVAQRSKRTRGTRH